MPLLTSGELPSWRGLLPELHEWRSCALRASSGIRDGRPCWRRSTDTGRSRDLPPRQDLLLPVRPPGPVADLYVCRCCTVTRSPDPCTALVPRDGRGRTEWSGRPGEAS